jgi:hypothetical protein
MPGDIIEFGGWRHFSVNWEMVKIIRNILRVQSIGPKSDHDSFVNFYGFKFNTYKGHSRGVTQVEKPDSYRNSAERCWLPWQSTNHLGVA